MKFLRKNNIQLLDDKLIVTVHNNQYVYGFDDISGYLYNEKKVIIEFDSAIRIELNPISEMSLIKEISKRKKDLNPKYIGQSSKSNDKITIMIPYILATLLYLFATFLIIILLSENQFEMSDIIIATILILLWVFWIVVTVIRFNRK